MDGHSKKKAQVPIIAWDPQPAPGSEGFRVLYMCGVLYMPSGLVYLGCYNKTSQTVASK